MMSRRHHHHQLALFCCAVPAVLLLLLLIAAAGDVFAAQNGNNNNKKKPLQQQPHIVHPRAASGLSFAEEYLQKTTKRPHAGGSKKPTFAAGTGKIKHIVILMLENNAFNRMLGYRKGVNGVGPKGSKPAMCNPVHLSDPAAGEVCYTPTATNVPAFYCDPNHDALPQALGTWGLDALAHNFSNPHPPMNGWVDKARRYHNNAHNNSHDDYCSVMACFTPAQLPIMNALADDFLLMDDFRCSLVMPTWPNRLFALTGTSRGLTETSTPWYRDRVGELYPQRNIFDQVYDAGLEWRVVVNDSSWEFMVDTIANHPENIQLLSAFMDDAKNDRLPHFAYLNPRSGVNLTTGLGSTDQHPPHQINHGESYVKDIYEALRASPAWDRGEILFIWDYDEQGGYADHVPPVPAPAPDDFTAWPDDWVKFTHSGLRSPFLLISPWLPKNTVVGAPPASAQPVVGSSRFELTSVLRLVRSLLGIDEGPLTRRDAWSADMSYLFAETTFNITTPRQDTPKHLPFALRDADDAALIRAEGEAPLDSLQDFHMQTHAHFAGQPYHRRGGMKQRDLSATLMQHREVHTRHTLRHKASHTGRVGARYRDAMLRRHRMRNRGAKQQQQPPLHQLAGSNKNEAPHPAEYVPYHGEAEQLYLRCQSMIQPRAPNPNRTMLTNEWMIDYPIKPGEYVTIASNVSSNASSGAASWTWYCVTADEGLEEGSVVHLATCLPRREPRFNRDKHQWWYFESQTMTIRPYMNPSLCVTHHCIPNENGHAYRARLSSKFTLERCGSETQVFDYQGGGGGVVLDNKGTINIGDAVLAWSVTRDGRTSEF